MTVELACRCAWSAQTAVDYRPFLDEPAGVRHLARWMRGEVVTWCGRAVPADHRCPTEDELREWGVAIPTFCCACARAWADRETARR